VQYAVDTGRIRKPKQAKRINHNIAENHRENGCPNSPVLSSFRQQAYDIGRQRSAAVTFVDISNPTVIDCLIFEYVCAI
jgi:hypothetical protein